MSRRWGRALAVLVEGITTLQKPWRRTATRLRAAHSLAQRITVATRHGELVFVASHARELHLLRHFHSREPETLSWIDGFDTPCRLWDVGANIGVYALYAGQKAGVEVAAFEPGAANFLALCRNVDTNNLSDRVRAYCLAFTNETRVGQLHLSHTAPGGDFNVFGVAENCFGHTIEIAAHQATLGFSIDEFRQIFNLPAPNYLKIDVDSVEDRILAGARDTLRDRQLHSVLIEIEGRDTPRNARLIGLLREAGLELISRSRGDGRGTANAIFSRTDSTSDPARIPVAVNPTITAGTSSCDG